ncbi:hypothetical protein CPB83DRAFT_889642 [Crepidotus variabilis]|uniref:Uncharacterized protein n=1 Tax=Crepidotus variabilis TaxID=179855 RepID=A0A9P6ERJ5_9AGAR|nr:hypothetical protein CPB83DRAFT_889642 [Crepidotus variabilis]
MSKLVEIRYILDMNPTSQWLGSAFSKGLSALSNQIGTITVQAEVQFQPSRSKEAPLLGEHMQAISGMKNLHTFEFTSSGRNLPSDLDDVWRAMKAAGIRLRSISVDVMSPSLLEYLASFSGLHNLALSPLPLNTMERGDGQEKMASFLFENVVVQHSRTLSHFAVTGKTHCWSISNLNISALARCQFLTSLTTPLCIPESDNDSDIRASVELLFQLIQNLPSLHQMILKLTASGPSGSHMLTMAKPSVSVHNAVTSIEHHEVSLVPGILTIEYGATSRSVEYRLVEMYLSSSATTWCYYAEKPGWLGKPCIDRTVRIGCVLRRRVLPVAEDILQQRQQQIERHQLVEVGRVTYTAEQKAKGVLPGQF